MKVEVHQTKEDLILYVSREFDVEYSEAKEMVESKDLYQ